MITITEDAKVKTTISVLVSLLAAIAGGVWWAASSVNALNTKLAAMNMRIESLGSETTARFSAIVEANKAALTLDRAAEMALRQAMWNPGHLVPDPRNPSQPIDQFAPGGDGRHRNNPAPPQEPRAAGTRQ